MPSSASRRELIVLGLAEIVEGAGHILLGHRMPNLATRTALHQAQKRQTAASTYAQDPVDSRRAAGSATFPAPSKDETP